MGTKNDCSELTKGIAVWHSSCYDFRAGMAFMPLRTIPACFRLSESCSGWFLAALFAPSPPSELTQGRDLSWSSHFSNFSTSALKKGSSLRDYSGEVLLERLGAALDDQKTEVAWETFSSFRKFYGFPDISITSRLITNLTYSSDPQWLRNACDLVFLYLRKKAGVFQLEILAKLALAMARAQLPVLASKILRLLLERNSLPPLSLLSLIVLHMGKTETGTCLVSNILIQVCDDLSNKPKPDTVIFNLVLSACVRFKSSLRALQLIELMAGTGVVADANSLVNFSCICEMYGLRDEIVKYKDFIDRVSIPLLVRNYRQFYDCLFSLHFKFNDIGSAAELVQDIYRDRETSHLMEELKRHFVPIGSHNLKSGLKILVEPGKMDEDCSTVVENEQKYIVFRDGKLDISKIALAKLIHGYKKNGNVDQLSRFLLSIRNHASLFDVVSACIHVGWLETAHDILDDLESAGSIVGPVAYISLLEAYNCKGMIREARALVKQMQKAGLISDIPNEMTISALLEKERPQRSAEFSGMVRKLDLAELLVQEMQEEQKEVPWMVYDVNSSIYFFCKAKMMEDALRTYRRMQEMNLLPNEQTFATMLGGYSSLKMYRDITILWGDIKRSIASGNLAVSRDLYESLLMNFIRGGYFERVMEVIRFMEEENMFVDKGMCMWEFRKLHKNLYRRLKASEATTEAQLKRLTCVKEFKKWMFTD